MKGFKELQIFSPRILMVMSIMFMAALLVTFLASSCSADIVEKEVVKEVIKEVKVEVEKDPGELVLYSGRKESLVGAIVEQFEDATGIDVKVKYDKTFPLAAMILEEGDNSPADIFFAQDPGGL